MTARDPRQDPQRGDVLRFPDGEVVVVVDVACLVFEQIIHFDGEPPLHRSCTPQCWRDEMADAMVLYPTPDIPDGVMSQIRVECDGYGYPPPPDGATPHEALRHLMAEVDRELAASRRAVEDLRAIATATAVAACEPLAGHGGCSDCDADAGDEHEPGCPEHRAQAERDEDARDQLALAWWARRPAPAPQQPAPTPGVGDVWGAIIEELPEGPARDLAIARRALGIARYGVPLQLGNGRDTRRDLAEELVDAACYGVLLAAERLAAGDEDSGDGAGMTSHRAAVDLCRAAGAPDLQTHRALYRAVRKLAQLVQP